jgi:hypothetical protein
MGRGEGTPPAGQAGDQHLQPFMIPGRALLPDLLACVRASSLSWQVGCYCFRCFFICSLAGWRLGFWGVHLGLLTIPSLVDFLWFLLQAVDGSEWWFCNNTSFLCPR